MYINWVAKMSVKDDVDWMNAFEVSLKCETHFTRVVNNVVSNQWKYHKTQKKRKMFLYFFCEIFKRKETGMNEKKTIK